MTEQQLDEILPLLRVEVPKIGNSAGPSGSHWLCWAMGVDATLPKMKQFPSNYSVLDALGHSERSGIYWLEPWIQNYVASARG